MNDYKGVETWGQISTRQTECPYIDPKEIQRQERIAVGRICRCRNCFCCKEAGLTEKFVFSPDDFLCQDLDRKLSLWFESKVDAKETFRRNEWAR